MKIIQDNITKNTGTIINYQKVKNEEKLDKNEKFNHIYIHDSWLHSNDRHQLYLDCVRGLNSITRGEIRVEFHVGVQGLYETIR